MNDSAMHTRPDAWQESTESQSKEEEVRKYLRCLVFFEHSTFDGTPCLGFLLTPVRQNRLRVDIFVSRNAITNQR